MKAYFFPLVFPLFLLSLKAAPPFQLPTKNQYLFTGEPEKFFMHVDRTFEGKTSKPWEGGSWGLVRNPVRVGGAVHFTRFHEGIDIAPLKRDASGEPLDEIMAVADGEVVHVCDAPGGSNYGRYIVITHPIDHQGSVICSLYAHLARCDVQPGDSVRQGQVIGKMGHTGVGLDRARSHCHLELALLMHSSFEDWYKQRYGGVNRHGIYNGMNLMGMDVTNFYLQQQRNPDLTVPEYIRSCPPYFKVTVPRNDALDIVERNRWLAYGDHSQPSPSWEIAFTATGLPIGVAPSERVVDRPIVSAVKKSDVPHRYLTRSLLTGEGSTAEFSRGGRDLIELVTGPLPAPEQAVPATPGLRAGVR